MVMININKEKHCILVNQNFNNAIKNIEELYQYCIDRNHTELKEILEIAINWYETNDISYYSFFKKAFRCSDKDPTDFYAGLNSFLSNVILDDSYYEIKWEKYTDGGLIDGQPYDELSYPHVVWADPDIGTNKAKPMLDIMKFVVEREKAREEYYEREF